MTAAGGLAKVRHIIRQIPDNITDNPAADCLNYVQWAQDALACIAELEEELDSPERRMDI